MKEVLMAFFSSVIKNDTKKDDLKKDYLLRQSNSIYENNDSEKSICR
jgi:hypothetical protein